MEPTTTTPTTPTTPKATDAPKAAKRTPKRTPKATGAKAAPKAAKATGSSARKAGSAKATPKAAPKATGPRLTGPTPERIALAKKVAGLRAKGAKWNEIATATGKSEPTLAKLRKDVRAGVFAKVSPVANRVPATGKGSF